VARNFDKGIYRQKCKLLAKQIARLRIPADQVPLYLSKQRWFMEMQGVIQTSRKCVISKSGAIGMFGKDWCDECMREELLNTGAYIPAIPTNDPNVPSSFFDLKLKY
jgi:hypothetical protein